MLETSRVDYALCHSKFRCVLILSLRLDLHAAMQLKTEAKMSTVTLLAAMHAFCCITSILLP